MTTKTKAPVSAKTTKPAETSESSKAVTLYVKDFGAKGDGTTDDGDEVMAACAALMAAPDGSTLVFESKKTYLIDKSPLGVALWIEGGKNKSLKGNGSTILANPANGVKYLVTNNTVGMTVEGLNFNYSKEHFFIGKTESIDKANKKAITEMLRRHQTL